MEPAATLDALLDLLRAGGPILGVLMLVSIAALTLIFGTLYQFRRNRISDRHFVPYALKACRLGKPEDVRALLNVSPNPIARVLELALFSPYGPKAEATEEAIEQLARGQLVRLSASFRLLETIVTLSPLLGLLGTVFGMIDSFNALELAGGRADPRLLAGGISKALLTTAGGLLIAIPTAAVLTWFESVVERLRYDMEHAATEGLAIMRSRMETHDAAA